MSIRVVLADDHRMLRESLRRSLEAEGFDVIAEAGDGAEAVDLAEALAPDVVLMDITMPDVDGIEATRTLHAEAPDVKVVMLTMHADQDLLVAAIRAGAAGYLVKDCSIEDISAAVRAAAEGETLVPPELAASMLGEARRLDPPSTPEEQRIITKREEEVLQLIADGCSPPEVAQRLYISQKTVKNHLASIYEKLDARDRTQAVLRAVRMGIVQLR